MLDLTKSPIQLKALVLLVTLNVALSACSSSRVSPDDITSLPTEVTDSELTQMSAPTPEPLIEAASTSTLSSEVPVPQPPRKYKRSARHHKVAKLKKQIVKKDVVEQVKQDIAKDFAKDQEALLASTATVTDVSNDNTTPPQAELSEIPAIIDPSLGVTKAGGNNWVLVSVAGFLGLALLGLGLRARRSKTPRRLVLNS